MAYRFRGRRRRGYRLSRRRRRRRRRRSIGVNRIYRRRIGRRM